MQVLVHDITSILAIIFVVYNRDSIIFYQCRFDLRLFFFFFAVALFCLFASIGEENTSNETLTSGSSCSNAG